MHYERAKRQFPAMYPVEFNFKVWLSYLANPELIVQDETSASITVFGRYFLVYLLSTGKGRPYIG